MSTYDRDEWQLWQPERLLEQSEPLSVSPPLPVEERDPLSDRQFQAELLQLRQQAEQEGYAAGERRGRDEGHVQGYQAGFEQGKQEGKEQGAAESRAEQQALVARFTRLVNEFQAALDSLDSVIPARLVQFALSAVRAMLGKHIVIDTSQLLEKIRLLMQENLRFTQPVELWVSRDDFSLVSEQLGDVLESHRWTLSVDDTMLPGGCRITSEEGELDATLATGWQALVEISKRDDLA
ncbi:flagellar assembly protein FliH [Pantoea sp. KPR_PJ]|uniref:flagellar assembly protein FliH n=1 Tax=Pantoea sp. KPR_PJ TaxID=2738375 RepID=UPI00352861A1